MEKGEKSVYMWCTAFYGHPLWDWPLDNRGVFDVYVEKSCDGVRYRTECRRNVKTINSEKDKNL